MYYISTRKSENPEKVSSATAIKQGIAANGGLFMPETIPSLSKELLNKLLNMSYPERAAEILSLYLTDYTKEELLEDCKAAYAERFVGGIAPVVKADDGIHVLELWHGPTCAFKDMALQIMPRLLSRALVKTNEKRNALILVATSGDTGKAALEGYRDVKQTDIMVFYPENGVSAAQKRQMITQEGENVNVSAIKGNFDDAQTGVKKIFADKNFAKVLSDKNYFLSSANSINWGRLVPQIVYYVSAYCDLVNQKEIGMGDKIDVCVPTGNFGNILAAYLAKKMGLPIRKLICASNSNNVLTDFFRTGTYDRNREFRVTVSPSMDILISSNLERLLYLIAGQEKCGQYMADLAKYGRYTVEKDVFDKISEDFVGDYCTENECLAQIGSTFSKNGYLIDTHTSVAVKAAYAKRSKLPVVVASTASPYKFAPAVCRALGISDEGSDLEVFSRLKDKTGVEIPAPLTDVFFKKVRFSAVNEPENMQKAVLDFTTLLG